MLRVPDLSHVQDSGDASSAPCAAGMVLSPQQTAIVGWVERGTGSLFVEALAGTGKTTTLMLALPYTRGSVRLVAFGKPIATELQLRIGAAGLDGRCAASTFHSLGDGAVRRRFPNARLELGLKKDFAMGDALRVPREQIGGVSKLIGFAKQQLIDPTGEDLAPWLAQVWKHDIALDLLGRERRDRGAREALMAGDLDRQLEAACELARRGLGWHNAHAEAIKNFDDMIYLPVFMDLAVQKYDWVLVDEGQDTNPGRRELAAKMMRPDTRSIWVGDRRQGIMGFTGADNDAVDLIIKQFGCTTLPLTVTYRCGRAIVEKARTWVPAYEAAATNSEGLVRTIKADALHAESFRQPSGEQGGDAILCRLTAPLVSLAFDLIKLRVACHVEGRDIGAGLVKLLDKFKNGASDLVGLTRELTAWREREVARLLAAKKEAQAAAIEDKVDTLLVLMENCSTVEGLRATVEGMFKDGDKEGRKTLTLSTVHKAKGREWGRVYVYGMNRWMPLPWVKAEWQLEQERNLSYVAVTRARNELVLVDVPME
jgi:superfamily I DNA/RNA helicase